MCTRSTTCPIRARRDAASPDPTDQDYMVSLGPYMQKQAPKNDTNGDETNLTKNKSGQFLQEKLTSDKKFFSKINNIHYTTKSRYSLRKRLEITRETI